MTGDLRKYEKSLKKEHRFGWTPSYKEETRTQLAKAVFIPIVVKAIEKLEWDIVYQDESRLEAKRRDNWDQWTEKIVVSYDFGKVNVRSVSLNSNLWDNGQNSKRVKLFIYVLIEVEKGYDKKALAALEEEVNRIENWDDYELPKQLEAPRPYQSPKGWILIIAGISLSICLGYLLAFLTIEGVYIIGLFEVGVALAIAYSFKFLIKLSNYANFDKLNYLIIGMILLTYFLNQYFTYTLIMNENGGEMIGFGEFIKYRFKLGLTIDSLEMGWIGLLISWIFQLGFTWLIAYLRLFSIVTAYFISIVPQEVMDFTYYHFIKGKSKDEVRMELSKMGWKKTEDQNDVFTAIMSIQEHQEVNRGE